MGKLETLLKAGQANIDESMGVGVARGPGVPSPVATSAPARWQGVSRSRDAVEIPVEKVERDPDQPREEFDEDALGRLARSLRARGQLQPIRVRWEEGRGAYVILCGERRWRAARMAGLASVSCVVVEGEIPPAELLAIQLVENCLREDLRPIEQAKAFRSLMDGNGWSARRLAEELAIDHSGVVRALALLDLPPAVRGHIERGDLSPTTAYEISKLDDPAAREDLGLRAAREGLTGATVKEEIRRRKDPRPASRKVDYKAPNGALVSVCMPEDRGEEFAAEALGQVLRALRKSLASRTEAA
jgi:ParB family chromosome partitioning protein